jgi:adenosine deaminase
VLFDIELVEEYRRASDEIGIDRSGIAALLRNGVRATFMDAGRKTAALKRLDDALAASGLA